MKWLDLAVLAMIARGPCDPPVTYEPPPEKRAQDVERQSFEEAKALAAKGDVDGARAKLSQIKADSPLRTTPEFADIENNWARAQIAAADKESDKTKKMALLDAVAKETAVSGELRASANQKLGVLAPDPAIPPPDIGYDPKESAARIAKANELGRQRKLAQARDVLLGPVLAHKAAPEEGALVLTVCVNLKDQACLGQLTDAGVIDQKSLQTATNPAVAASAAAAASAQKK